MSSMAASTASFPLESSSFPLSSISNHSVSHRRRSFASFLNSIDPTDDEAVLDGVGVFRPPPSFLR